MSLTNCLNCDVWGSPLLKCLHEKDFRPLVMCTTLFVGRGHPSPRGIDFHGPLHMQGPMRIMPLAGCCFAGGEQHQSAVVAFVTLPF